MSVSQGTWLNRLKKNLKTDYQSLASHLGPKGFSELVRSFLDAHPPDENNLASVGNPLPEFLEKWDNPLKQPWQPDLARLERSIYLSYTGTDPAPWDLTELLKSPAVEPESLRFSFESTTSMHRSEWSINTLRTSPESTPKKNWNYLLVYRSKQKVKVLSMAAEECALLRDVVSGLSLGEILELYPDTETVELLSYWASEGIVRPVGLQS